MRTRIQVNPVTCEGHGLCAEMLPEMITLDDWGYPIVADAPIGERLLGHARRAVTNCPALALRLERVADHCKNIAEEVYYLYHAIDIRHERSSV